MRERLRPQQSLTPSEKVSIWHRDITLVTPKQLRGSPRPQHAQYQIYGRHKRRPQPLPREAAQHRRLASQHRQSRHTAASRHVPHPHPPPPPPQDKQPPSLPEVRTKEERLPESSEVVIDPRGHVTQRPAARCQHVARGLKPSYAASARKVLMSSGRGLLRLQGSLGRGRSASPQSLYVNDQFPEAAPCPAQGCPLNPRTRYSVSGGTEEQLFSRTSSTTDYDIKVRKAGEVYTNKKWCLCIAVAILIVGVFTAAGIYFGYEYLKANEPSAEAVYGGQFRVTGRELVSEPGSIFHLSQAERFRAALHRALAASPLADMYRGTEVFLLETGDEGFLETVHFNLHFGTESRARLHAPEVREVLGAALNSSRAIPEAEAGSLTLTERKLEAPARRRIVHHHRRHKTSKHESVFPEPSGVTRQCVPLESGYCSNLPYNTTTYPNMLGHSSIQEVDMVIDIIKEVVDSGCHPLAYEMLCMTVQPVCYNDKVVSPCSAFCSEFMAACDGYIPAHLLDSVRCHALPTEADGPGACISKPGCVKALRAGGQEGRVCDGVVDCPDFSDELYCDYCPERHFHCGVGKQCIDKARMCDGRQDCDNGADERGCVSLSPALSVGSYTHQYYSQGYLIYQHQGQAGKVCADSLNTSLSLSTEQSEDLVRSLANSTCRHLQYSELAWAAVTRDTEESAAPVQYVGLGSLETGDKFEAAECKDKMVIRLECRGLQCGARPAATESADTAAGHVARHGDWPWHVTLVREGTHVCDGTLVQGHWVMSTKSCFQGQQRARWVARLASVRLSSRPPWQQERRVVGMVASPAENTNIVLLKLQDPVQMSDFARAACLAAPSAAKGAGRCLALGWDSATGELRTQPLAAAPRAQCAEDTEVAANSVCMTAPGPEEDSCRGGEMMAGHGLLCETEAGAWQLVGVAAWRRGCGSVGQRPRLYEMVNLTSAWAETVISLDTAPSQHQVPRRRLG